VRHAPRLIVTFASTLSLSLLLSLPAALVACGGKIAGDPRGSSGDDPSRDPIPSPGASAPTTPPSSSLSSPFPPAVAAGPSSSGITGPSTAHTVDDACASICERNGECGTAPPDCADSCAAQIRSASSCSAQATAYIQCYAGNLVPGCAALPPVCESAYCAYTTCAGKVVPDYCESR
jgi:hypothetical protein